MQYALFLDDMRSLPISSEIFPPAVQTQNMAVVVARDFEQFRTIVESLGEPFSVSFDHDLHFDHYPQRAEEQEEDHKIDYRNDPRYARHETGWHCAEWFRNKCKLRDWDYPAVNIHSRNVPGSNNIASLFEHEGGIECTRTLAD